jgi:hypothetical protein
MKAGSIMNEAIAIKVMRWPLVQKKYEGDGLIWGFQSPQKHYLHYELPKFSGDIAAAWRVVERIPGQVDVIKLESGRFTCIVDTGQKLTRTGKMTMAISEGGDGAPEAICKAALRLLSSDVGAKDG